MNGSILNRGKDTWRISYDLPRGEDGKRRQRYMTVHGTKKVAREALRQKLTQLDNGIVIEPSKDSVAQYLRHWLAVQQIRPTTRQGYTQIIEHHLAPHFTRIPLQRLSPAHVEAYYHSKRNRIDANGNPAPLSEQTLLHHHRLLNKSLVDAVRNDLIQRNPLDRFQPRDKPKPPDRIVSVLTPDQTHEFLALFDDDKQLQCMVLLAVTTGLRRGEVLGLKWDAVNLTTGKIQVVRSLTKAGLEEKLKTQSSRRSVTLAKLSINALVAHKARQSVQKLALGQLYDDEGFLFAHEDGRPISPHSFTSSVRWRVKGTKLAGTGIHTLRHTHASHLLKQGQHPKVVSERLGHSNVSITLNTYSHLMKGMEEAAAEAIDALFPVTN